MNITVSSLWRGPAAMNTQPPIGVIWKGLTSRCWSFIDIKIGAVFWGIYCQIIKVLDDYDIWPSPMELETNTNKAELNGEISPRKKYVCSG